MAEFEKNTRWDKRLYCDGGNGPNIATVSAFHALAKEDNEIFRGGRSRWAVYAYVYNTHARFKEWVANEGNAIRDLEIPGHSYLSLVRLRWDDTGTPTAIHFGFDYDHLHDDCHRACPVECPDEYLRDAERLGAWLVAQHEESSDG